MVKIITRPDKAKTEISNSLSHSEFSAKPKATGNVMHQLICINLSYSRE